MEYEQWITAGERMGLSGTVLQQYVEKREKEYDEREERAARREVDRMRLEEEKAKREREQALLEHERMVRYEAEKAKREEDRLRLEQDRIRLEDERAAKAYALKKEAQEREAILKREEQEREIAILKLKAETGVSKSEAVGKTLRPKLPKFEEQKDDMDAYIERFERFAKSQGWKENTWAISLSSLLTGKGLEVYTSMPPEQSNGYAELKKAMLKRYLLTEEGFRLKFRDSKPEHGETVFQFMARLVRYLTRWVEMAELDGTFETLMDLIVREQFIKTCAPELALFLRERMPKSRAEVTQLAEQYIEAHGGSIMSQRGTRSNQGAVPKQTQRQYNAPAPKQHGSSNQRQDVQKRTCYICHKEGHIARDCKQNDQKHGDAKSSNKPHGKHQVSGLCLSVNMEQSPIKDCIKDGELQLANGKSVPIIAGGCTIESLEGERKLDLKKGYVGDRQVRVLRDTGCEKAAVRKELVRDDQMLEKKCVMVTIDGRATIVPVAEIEVDTPYYVGRLEAMVLNSLICDLVLGNMDCVSDTPDQQWSRQKRSEPLAENVAAAVMTRAQAQKEQRPLRALNVPSSQFDGVDIEQLKKAQKDDTSLSKLWGHADSGSEMKTKGGNGYRYTVRQDTCLRRRPQIGSHQAFTGQASPVM